MEDIETLAKYIWLAFVTLVGGVLGFIKKISPTLTGATLCAKLQSLLLSVATSMFVAYITYEVALWSIGSERLAIAFAGLASFAGTDLLVVLQGQLIEWVRERVE